MSATGLTEFPSVTVNAALDRWPRYLDEAGQPAMEWQPGGKELAWTTMFGYVYFDVVANPTPDWPYYERRTAHVD